MKAFLKKLVKKVPFALSKNHGYDLCTTRLIRELPAAAVTIDVGCHKGEILDELLKSAPSGRHYGLEPIPSFYEKLVEKYQGNQKAKILNFAASDSSGKASFNYVESNPAYSGLLKRRYDRPEEIDKSIEVDTEKLDVLIPTSEAIDFIKIDVEGAELKVLKGAQRILSSSRPQVVFEHGLGGADIYGYGAEEVFDFFFSLDYSVYELTGVYKTPLSRDEMIHCFTTGKAYYFLARTN